MCSGTLFTRECTCSTSRTFSRQPAKAEESFILENLASTRAMITGFCFSHSHSSTHPARSQIPVRTLESLIIVAKYGKISVRFAHKTLKLSNSTLNIAQYQEISVNNMRGWGGRTHKRRILRHIHCSRGPESGSGPSSP